MVSSNALKLASATLLTCVAVIAACSGDGDRPPIIGDPNPDAGPPGRTCAAAGDCRSGVCSVFQCKTATNRDGIQNADESDVDCGGALGPACDDGKSCAKNSNCTSGLCSRYRCSGRRGGDGGGVGRLEGCGRGRVKRCEGGEPCETNDDCASYSCDPATKTCEAPALDDGVMNGGETDVDCGGPAPARRCAAGKSCKEHSDCDSHGCAFDGRCAMGATCTELEGGHTCGPADTMTKQNDCCARARVGEVTIDKYLVTAGRMRVFLTRLGGRVRDFAATLPANRWNQAWTELLPNAIDGTPDDADNANTQLGPYFGKRSCASGSYNGHTYWTPPAYGDEKQDFPREVLDTKALNCVPWSLLAALCAFDGGHLATEAEIHTAYTNDGTTPFPWGERGSYTTATQTPYAVQAFSYGTPNPPVDARRSGNDFVDSAYHIAPPGRRPLGYSAAGVADLVGNLLEWVGDGDRHFVWNGSWERHAQEADGIESPGDDDPYMAIRPQTGEPWRWHIDVSPTQPNGYYAIGGRCAH